MKVTHAVSLVANSGNTAYGVDVIILSTSCRLRVDLNTYHQ